MNASTRIIRLQPARAAGATTLATIAAALLATPAARAADGASETHFQVGVAAVSGMNDLRKKIEANNPYIDLSTILPLGLAVGAWHEFDSGLGLGVALGPVVAATGDASFTVVPLTLDLRWRFAYTGSMRPYVRLGVEKAFANGDFISDGSAGAVAGVGFSSGPSGGWGFELAYHSTEVKIARTIYGLEKKAKPYEATLTAFYVF